MILLAIEECLEVRIDLEFPVTPWNCLVITISSLPDREASPSDEARNASRMISKGSALRTHAGAAMTGTSNKAS
jgi:hypothetical protein